MTMKDSTNHYHYRKQHPNKNRPVNVKPKTKTLIGFQSLSAAYLLLFTLAVIGRPTFITNGTVSYKYINIFGIV
jgi:hypothetical protein